VDTRPSDQQPTPFHIAAEAVASVTQFPGYDVTGYIAQMRDVSEETREKLLEKFAHVGVEGAKESSRTTGAPSPSKEERQREYPRTI